MNSYKQLRKFKKDELYLNEDETRIILKFIFRPTDHALIDSLPMTSHLKGFAQGLLVEAIDASYAIGFVQAIFRSTTNPTKGALAILKKFGKKAIIHWLKHATIHDLQNIKIYDFVRDHLAQKFRFKLYDFLASLNLDKQPSAFLAYSKPTNIVSKVWG